MSFLGVPTSMTLSPKIWVLSEFFAILGCDAHLEWIFNQIYTGDRPRQPAYTLNWCWRVSHEHIHFLLYLILPFVYVMHRPWIRKRPIKHLSIYFSCKQCTDCSTNSSTLFKEIQPPNLSWMANGHYAARRALNGMQRGTRNSAAVVKINTGSWILLIWSSTETCNICSKNSE